MYSTSFARGKWNPEDFWHTAIYGYHYRKPFEQLKDCIQNGYIEDAHMPTPEESMRSTNVEEIPGLDRSIYAYTSYTFKQKITLPCSFSVTFRYEEFGSPTFYFAKEVFQDGEQMILGSHIEATVWEEGINFWNLERDGRQYDTMLLFHEKFHPAANQIYPIKLMLEEDRYGISFCGRERWIKIDLGKSGYIGFLGCEGVNAFYDFCVW